MYLVPIFSPEYWQSVGSSALLSPPQERTVSRRRRETTKCASALNARMNSGNRTANHFAVFVQEPRHTISKPVATEIHEVRTYMLPSGDDNMCGLRRSKNRETTGIFGTGCVIVIPSHATLSQLPLVRAAPRHPRHRAKCTLKKSLRASGKPSKSVAVIANESEAR